MAVCTNCSTTRAIGKVAGKPLPGTMSDLCLTCVKDLVIGGTCPMCRSGFDTVEHIECLTHGVTPMVESSYS